MKFPIEYLFVYGTLMKKYNQNPLFDVLEANTTFIGEAFTYGKLYLVDYFPGLMPNLKGENHKTFGELVSFKKDSDLLKHLDDYEDYNANDLCKSLYVRKIAEIVHLETGLVYHANVYFYNQNVDKINFLINGRFLSK